MPDETPADPVAAELVKIRERSERPLGPDIGALPISNDAVRHLMESASDVPRLLAALEEVFKAHRDVGGRCARCMGPYGLREPWPCGEYQVVSRKLLGTGEGSGDGG